MKNLLLLIIGIFPNLHLMAQLPEIKWEAPLKGKTGHYILVTEKGYYSFHTSGKKKITMFDNAGKETTEKDFALQYPDEKAFAKHLVLWPNYEFIQTKQFIYCFMRFNDFAQKKKQFYASRMSAGLTFGEAKQMSSIPGTFGAIATASDRSYNHTFKSNNGAMLVNVFFEDAASSKPLKNLKLIVFDENLNVKWQKDYSIESNEMEELGAKQKSGEYNFATGDIVDNAFVTNDGNQVVLSLYKDSKREVVLATANSSDLKEFDMKLGANRSIERRTFSENPSGLITVVGVFSDVSKKDIKASGVFTAILDQSKLQLSDVACVAFQGNIVDKLAGLDKSKKIKAVDYNIEGYNQFEDGGKIILVTRKYLTLSTSSYASGGNTSTSYKIENIHCDEHVYMHIDKSGRDNQGVIENAYTCNSATLKPVCFAIVKDKVLLSFPLGDCNSMKTNFQLWSIDGAGVVKESKLELERYWNLEFCKKLTTDKLLFEADELMDNFKFGILSLP